VQKDDEDRFFNRGMGFPVIKIELWEFRSLKLLDIYLISMVPKNFE
jgi:hypothetical protein